MAGGSAAGWHWSLGTYGSTGYDGMAVAFLVGLAILALCLTALSLLPRKPQPPVLTWASASRSRGPHMKAAPARKSMPSTTVASSPKRKEPVAVRGYRRVGQLVALQTIHQAPGLSNFVARRRRRRP